MLVQLSPPNPVICQPINTRIGVLWDLLWNDLKGEPDWEHTSKRDFSFWPTFWVCKQGFELQEITGGIRQEPFKISFVGISKGSVRISYKGAYYQFSSNPKFGSFETKNSIYSKNSDACVSRYQGDWGSDREAAREWIDSPDEDGTSELLTQSDLDECLHFLDELIELLKARIADRNS